MKKILLVILISILSVVTAQNKEGNVIISINQNIHPILSNLYLLDEFNNKYYITYYPGSFKLNESDYKKLLNNNSYKLVLSDNLYCFKNHRINIYEIEDFKLSWLDQPYFILNIYNTDIKRYKKKYNPLESKNYTYEYDYPGGSMKRVQKNFTKERQKCK